MKKVFVSSTVWDMTDIRAELHEFLSKNGFQPLMSDRADFGEGSELVGSYEKCYKVLKECNIFLLIINSRYGGKKDYKEGEVSITHQEFRWALEEKKDFIGFIRDRTVTDYDIWKKSGRSNNAVTSFVPKGKDFKIFEFIDEIYRSAPGGGALWFMPFSNSIDLKKQLTFKLGISDYSNNYLAQAQAINALPKLNIHLYTGSTTQQGKIQNKAYVLNVGNGTASDIKIVLYENAFKLVDYFIKAIPSNNHAEICFEYIFPGGLVLGNKNIKVMMEYKNNIGNTFESEYVFSFENNDYSCIPKHNEIYFGAPR